MAHVWLCMTEWLARRPRVVQAVCPSSAACQFQGLMKNPLPRVAPWTGSELGRRRSYIFLMPALLRFGRDSLLVLRHQERAFVSWGACSASTWPSFRGYFPFVL